MTAHPFIPTSTDPTMTKDNPKSGVLEASENNMLEKAEDQSRSECTDPSIPQSDVQLPEGTAVNEEKNIKRKPRKVTFGAVEEVPHAPEIAPAPQHEQSDEEDEDYILPQHEEDDNEDEEEEDMPAEQFASAIAEVSTLLKGRLKSFIDSGTLGSKPLHAAAATNDVSKLRQLLSDGSEYHDKINDVDVFQYNALHVAAERGCAEACKLLLGLGIDKNATTRMHQCTALHYAAFEGHDDVLTVLIDAGVDINAVTDDNRTALYQASLRGHVDCVDLLLRNGANREIKAEGGKTASQVASKEAIQFMFHQSVHKKARPSS